MDEISEIKNEKRILDAIDQLRRRKARPDVDRICNYMMRKFLIDPGETVADLERLVDADVVIKVEYKGNTSYRNAAKWSRYALYKNRPETASILTLNSEQMSALFAAALAELSSRDTTAGGVSYSEIEAYLQRKEGHFSKKLLDFMILRELNAGNILRLENGNFVQTAAGKDRSTNADNIKTEEKDVVKENEEEEEEKHHIEESENANNTNKTSNKSSIVNGKGGDAQNSNVGESGAITVSGFRIGVRRKRAKIVFDPSDHRAPTPRKRGRPAGSSNKNNHHQHHNSVHLHHSNNSSNNHSHISSSSNSSNSSTNGSHGLGGISLGVTGRHQLDLKDQIFKAHRPSSVVQPQTNNDNKRASIPCSVEGHCYVCGQGTNYRGNTERLIDCRDCVTNKVHPSCLEQQNGGISRVDGDSSGRNLGHSSAQSWQCADCRSCCICGGVSDSSSMVSCDGCEEWYHIYCHTPVLHERPRGGKWLCQQCLQDRTAYAHSVNGVGGLPTPRESPVPEGSQPHVDNGVCENGIADIDSVDTKHSACIDHGDPENKNTLSTPVKQKSAPDASNWTPVDVELYFRSVGFAEQAHVFRDQEVDGKSLLLMKRSDVLTGLGLKLGPALKMYTHVRRLQLRQHDDMAASDFMWT